MPRRRRKAKGGRVVTTVYLDRTLVDAARRQDESLSEIAEESILLWLQARAKAILRDRTERDTEWARDFLAHAEEEKQTRQAERDVMVADFLDYRTTMHRAVVDPARRRHAELQWLAGRYPGQDADALRRDLLAAAARRREPSEVG